MRSTCRTNKIQQIHNKYSKTHPLRRGAKIQLALSSSCVSMSKYYCHTESTNRRAVSMQYRFPGLREVCRLLAGLLLAGNLIDSLDLLIGMRSFCLDCNCYQDPLILQHLQWILLTALLLQCGEEGALSKHEQSQVLLQHTEEGCHRLSKDKN